MASTRSKGANRARLARLLTVTASSEEQAFAIGRALVGERIAACVNVVGPITSIYRWRGAVEEEREYLMLVKTRAALVPRVERRIAELHSYEVPEVLAFAPASGASSYLGWLLESTAAEPRKVAKARGRR